MKYTAGQAAKATGVATATITRALKSGKISGHKDDNGAWIIDPSELHRVFPPISLKDSESLSLKDREISVASNATALEINALERELQTLRDALSDAREDRDKWRDMAERLSLAPPTPIKNDKQSKPRSWKFWQREG
ncbi:hypothetical protein ACJKIH_24570 (plasmid) [Brucella pseudogrignonensis]|uniref:hypothetical protein n=1 Tax=Brucella pseudogrignonensis TaxID=419475 RepID=UPI0038B4823A